MVEELLVDVLKEGPSKLPGTGACRALSMLGALCDVSGIESIRRAYTALSWASSSFLALREAASSRYTSRTALSSAISRESCSRCCCSPLRSREYWLRTLSKRFVSERPKLAGAVSAVPELLNERSAGNSARLAALTHLLRADSSSISASVISLSAFNLDISSSSPVKFSL